MDGRDVRAGHAGLLMVLQLHSLAAGRPAGGDGAGGWIERVNPAHPDEVVGCVAAVDPVRTDEAVRAAHGAFASWSATPVGQRRTMLHAAADDVAATAGDLGPLLARELGKVAADCAGEMGFAAAYLRYAVDAFDRVSAPEEVDDELGRLRTVRRPYGVCAAIVPWNAPLILSILKVAPALACGNTIVVKPSPLAPLAVTEALRTVAEALPAGVLSVLHGDAEVGETLVGHPLVRKVAFTGGGTVARAVAGTAAQQVTPVVLELGGNDAALVLDDAPFDDEMYERLVWGTFLTSGQVCMAAKRLYVPAPRLDEFTEGYLDAAGRLLVMGDPLDPDVTIGPVASPAQRAGVEELVRDAARRGGIVHRLGSVAEGTDTEHGWYCRPTLVVGAEDHWPVVTEEQFGPTVPLLGYDSLDEAVDRVNADRYGLASSVWSLDEDRAFGVAERIEAGFTFVNCHNRAGMSLRAPFGGWKQSGYGREFGEAGVADYLQTHSVHVPSAMRLGDRAPGTSTAANAYPT
jgi:acyl-CoA reductase-like NAD-dependent aldehyde dehydrogenase